MYLRSITLKKRNSNIELLRILMMVLMIAHHFVVNSGLTDKYEYGHITKNMIFFQLFGMGGKIGICVFTIITGYFLVKHNISIRKILKLYITIKFWYFLFYIAFLITGFEKFSAKGLVKTVFSIEFEFNNLYCGTLIAMLFLIPFINILLKKLTKHQYRLLLVYLVFWIVICSSFFLRSISFLSSMVTCYIIGSYLGKYETKIDNLKRGIIGLLISIAIMIICQVGLDVFKGGQYNWLVTNLINSPSAILAVSTGIFLFITFKNIRMKNIAIINLLASATFGVLVIHANSDTMRRWLWKTVFNVQGHYNDKYAILYSIGVVLLVYIVCAILELIRLYTIDKAFFKWIDKKGWASKIERKIDFNKAEEVS